MENPLDASRFFSEPCAVLNQTQLSVFDVTRPGRPETTGGVAENAGPFCTWFSESGDSIGIGFLVGNENGLSDTYAGRDEIDSFIPTNVDGYPAVFANTPDLRSRGTCNLIVATSDSLTFQATEQGSLDAQGSCDRAKQVAAAALATIRGGS